VISNRRALREAFLDELKVLLLERDFYLLDMRNADAKSEFAIVSATFVNNLRPLPKTEYRNYRADL
jgi:hypothetical protein